MNDSYLREFEQQFPTMYHTQNDIMNNSYSLSRLDIPKPYELVLASMSKFRRQVLDDIHVEYIKDTSGINEKTIRDDDPKKLTMKLAEAKLDAVLTRNQRLNRIIITADQVAVMDGTIREKPVNKRECYMFLDSYSHSFVEFYSAICVYNSMTMKKYVNCDVSRIDFRDIPRSVQDYLVEIGDVMHTCGGITVENPEFQKCILSMDSFDRIMGTPLKLIQEGINTVCSSTVFNKYNARHT